MEVPRRMVFLLPLLASISDRLSALRSAAGMTPPLQRLLADLSVWVRAGARPPPSEAERLRKAIAQLEAETDPRCGWNEIMRGSLLLRLRQLVDVRQDMDLRQHIEAGGGALTSPLAVRLTLALGAFFVPVGLLAAMPATQPLGAALGFITATLLALQGRGAADFVSWADGSIAAIPGVAGAAVMTSLVRSVGAEWSARRLLRAGWRRPAAIPRSQTQQDELELIELLLDRIGRLVPRLAAVGAGNELAAVAALTDVRIGVNMVDLQRDRGALPPAVRVAVDKVLLGSATHYAVQAALGHVHQPSAALLSYIDRALDAVIAWTAPGVPFLAATGGHPTWPVCRRRSIPIHATARRRSLGRHCGEASRVIGEFDVYGVFVPALLVWGMIPLLLTALLRRVLAHAGFYRLVWHRPLVDLSLLVIILAAIVAVAPRWIAP